MKTSKTLATEESRTRFLFIIIIIIIWYHRHWQAIHLNKEKIMLFFFILKLFKLIQTAVYLVILFLFISQ